MKYIKSLLTLLVCALALSGCLKTETPQNEKDEQDLVAYLNAHNLTYTRDAYGYFYNIVDSGNGVALADTSVIDLKLEAKSLQETSLADTLITKAVYALSYSLRLGLTKAKVGGEMNIYVPAYLNDGVNGAINHCKVTAIYSNQAAADDTIITKYLGRHALTATKDTSGIYYNISVPGSDNRPTIDSTVTVKYTGKLTSDYVFDSTKNSATYTSVLKNLIKGWKAALPMLGEGGKGRFYIPSRLAYGTSTSSGLPLNSVLIFDIELVTVKK